MSIQLQLSDIMLKCLETVCYDATEWAQNAVDVRAKLAYDELIRDEIQRRFDAGEPILPVKDDNLRDAFARGIIKTAKQKSDEIKASSPVPPSASS
jgi:hypothetical protein